MKKNYLKILLACFMAIMMPFSFAYAYYDDLIEADFLTHGTKYEAGDMQNLFVEKQNFVGLTSDPSSTLLYVNDDFHVILSLLSPANLLLNPASSILRC
jgi:hypothetical protein